MRVIRKKKGYRRRTGKVRKHKQRYKVKKRSRKVPIEKTIPYLFSDELGFAKHKHLIWEDGKWVQDIGQEKQVIGEKDGGKFMAPSMMTTESLVPDELKKFSVKNPDSSTEFFVVPKHKKGTFIPREAAFLRRRAKEFQREVSGNVKPPKDQNTPDEWRAWSGKAHKEIKIEQAMDKMFGKEQDPFGTKFVRIISDDDKVRVMGPFKNLKVAEDAQKKYVKTVDEERRFWGKFDKDFRKDRAKKGMFPTPTRLSDDYHNIGGAVHAPWSIDIMSKSELDKYDYRAPTKEFRHKKLFPLDGLE